MLEARNQLIARFKEFEKRVSAMAESDPVCRRLMTVPQVGPVTALTYRTAVDEPRRFVRSANVGAHFGLTKASRQSGNRDRGGRISLLGDRAARSLLFLSAKGMMRKASPQTWLKAWGEAIRSRRGAMKAFIAVARRLAVILHKMWISETDFRFDLPKA